MIVKRGDMFYADLSPVIGSEQGGIRPVLIIQNDLGNKYSPTVIAAAITSQTNKTKLPTHIEIRENTSGLKNNSVVLVEQIRTIDKSRLKEKIGHIDDNKIIKDYIDSKVKYSSIDWQKSFIEEDCGYKSVIIPKNKNDHIKAMYDYLVVMTDRNKSLNGEAFNFHLGRCKVNERIQFYLNRVFLPLIHYINDYLIEEMIALQES